jgi:hypothetical protein
MGMVFDRYVKKEEEVFDKQELLDKNRQWGIFTKQRICKELIAHKNKNKLIFSHEIENQKTFFRAENKRRK